MIAINVEAFEINNAPGLDSIQVYFRDVGDGQGYVTITCWGLAWNTYFGAMGEGVKIREFFVGVGSDYMATKLGCRDSLKQRSRDEKYLQKIIEAVQQSIRANKSEVAA